MKHLLALIGAGMASALSIATSAVAQQHCSGPQIGTWKLRSYVTTDLATGQKSETFGAHPSGFLSYGSDCRMQAIVVKEGRKAPASVVPTDAERVDLFNGLIAYAGTYSIEGDIVSHHVDASWIQARTGTTQQRHFKIDGKTLHIETVPTKSYVIGRDTTSCWFGPKLNDGAPVSSKSMSTCLSTEALCGAAGY